MKRWWWLVVAAVGAVVLAGPAGLWGQEFRPDAAAAKVTVEPVDPHKAEREKLLAFLNRPIHFAQVCFRGETFPACDFDKPEEVKGIIGAYSLKVTFYDGAWRAVESAREVGRYGAVVEITYGARTTKRFVTLCRMGGQAVDGRAATTQPAELRAAGIDAEVLKEREKELPQKRAAKYMLYRPWETIDAILAAGLYDLSAMKKAGQESPKDDLVDLDRQWWVTLKRKLYGYEKMYPKEFVCPLPLKTPALVVHEGTLKEAGMSPDAVARIDKEAEAWMKYAVQGFSLCVVRHGVIVVHKAYGPRTRKGFVGDPFTTETVANLDSTTKFLSGVLLSEFADQGLIGIDEPVDKYVPTLRGMGITNMPTIRNLYLHNAGFWDAHWGDMLNDMEEEVADLSPLLEGWTVHKYQGAGHALGGKIMESMTGQSLPRLFQKHLFEPLGCKHMQSGTTSFGAVGTSGDLAKIGQMMLNGGAYGDLRFTSQKIIDQMQPIPGKDRFDPDKTIRWGVGIKMFDSDNFSGKGYGGSGSCGSFLKLDPTYDVVVAMVRDNAGDKYQEHRGALVKVVIDAIGEQK